MRIERDTTEWAGSDGWMVRKATGYAQATCSCGLDTGWVAEAEASRVFAEHREAVAA